jgi:hypothetical protein
VWITVGLAVKERRRRGLRKCGVVIAKAAIFWMEFAGGRRVLMLE